jgi:hypothetical protein
LGKRNPKGLNRKSKITYAGKNGRNKFLLIWNVVSTAMAENRKQWLSLCWWKICPRGYHPPSRHCYCTDVFRVFNLGIHDSLDISNLEIYSSYKRKY